MSKFINTAIAATIALAIAVPAGMQQAHAGKKGKDIALGVAAGIVGTAMWLDHLMPSNLTDEDEKQRNFEEAISKPGTG